MKPMGKKVYSKLDVKDGFLITNDLAQKLEPEVKKRDDLELTKYNKDLTRLHPNSKGQNKFSYDVYDSVNEKQQGVREYIVKGPGMVLSMKSVGATNPNEGEFIENTPAAKKA